MTRSEILALGADASPRLIKASDTGDYYSIAAGADGSGATNLGGGADLKMQGDIYLGDGLYIRGYSVPHFDAGVLQAENGVAGAHGSFAGDAFMQSGAARNEDDTIRSDGAVVVAQGANSSKGGSILIASGAGHNVDAGDVLIQAHVSQDVDEGGPTEGVNGEVKIGQRGGADSIHAIARQLLATDGSTVAIDWSDPSGPKLPTLPTSDPHVLNQLWNSSGTLKISAG